MLIVETRNCASKITSKRYFVETCNCTSKTSPGISVKKAIAHPEPVFNKTHCFFNTKIDAQLRVSTSFRSNSARCGIVRLRQFLH
jgi:hypothetical protein